MAKSKLNNNLINQISALILLGKRDKEIADALGYDASTYYKWLKGTSPLCEKLRLEVDAAKDEYNEKLFKLAEKKATQEGNIVEIRNVLAIRDTKKYSLKYLEAKAIEELRQSRSNNQQEIGENNSNNSILDDD